MNDIIKYEDSLIVTGHIKSKMTIIDNSVDKDYVKPTELVSRSFQFETLSGKWYMARGIIFELPDNSIVRLYGKEGIGNTFDFIGYDVIDDSMEGASVLLKLIFGNKKTPTIINVFDGSPVAAMETFKYSEDVFYHKVLTIKSIGKKTIDNAYKKYESYNGLERIFNTFSQYGLSMENALKIFKAYGGNSFDIIEENPYLLFRNLRIPFNVIDNIAIHYYGYKENSIDRIEEAMYFFLINDNMNGNTFSFVKNAENDDNNGIIDKVANMLNLSKATINEGYAKLRKSGKLFEGKYNGKDIIYIKEAYDNEVHAANNLARLLKKEAFSENDVLNLIYKYELEKSFTMDENQVKAVLTSCINKVSIISGPPGSGKTTIIDCILYVLKHLNKKINLAMAAPTGKAANRITNSTGITAHTIHKMLDYSVIKSTDFNDVFKYNADNKLPYDLIIIDETSMLGLSIFSKLLDAIKDNAHIIFLGDANQLPSVDYGMVLSDMINSEKIPFTQLTKVYRQEEGSALSTIIYNASCGIGINVVDSLKSNYSDSSMFSQTASDFDMYQEFTVASIIKKLNSIYDKLITSGVSEEQIAVLTPTNKGRLGTVNLNKILQEKVNPERYEHPFVKSGTSVFRLNDIVIQTINESKESVFNGMIGKVIDINNAESKSDIEDMTVEFQDGTQSTYTRDRYHCLSLAYSLTIHKTQGSEYDYVILLIPDSIKMELTRQLIYTGISRAKKHLYIIGNEMTFNSSLNNIRTLNRNSLLCQRIRVSVK